MRYSIIFLKLKIISGVLRCFIPLLISRLYLTPKRLLMNNSINDNDINLDKYQVYVSLLVPNYYRIFNYILSMVANFNDAEDIMQETSILMLRKFDDFERDTNFVGWANAIARYKVLEFIKKKKELVVLDQEMVDDLSNAYNKRTSLCNPWIDALHGCVGKLEVVDQKLLKMQYEENYTIKNISHVFGWSFQKIYRQKSRISGLLLRCIRREVDGKTI